LKARQKGVIFFRENYVIGLLGNPSNFNFEEFKAVVSGGADVKVNQKTEVQFVNKEKKSKDKVVTKDILSFHIIGEKLKVSETKEYLAAHGFEFMG